MGSFQKPKFLWGFLGLLLLCSLGLSGKEAESAQNQQSLKYFNKKANTLAAEGYYDSALQFYNKALANIKFDEEPATFLTIGNHKLELLLRHHGNYQYLPFAKELYKKGQTIKDQNPGIFLNTSRLYSQVYLANRKNVAKAKQLLKNTIKFHELHGEGDHEELAYVYNFLALALNFEDRYPRSRSYINKADSLIKANNIQNTDLRALTHRYKGHILKNLSYLDSAKNHYKKALALVKPIYPENHPELFTYYYDNSKILQKLSRLDSAMKIANSALDILKAKDMVESIKGGLIYLHLGSLCYNDAKLQKALLYHKRSKKIFEATEKAKFYNLYPVYNGLGIINRIAGYLSQSEKYIKQALKYANKVDNPRKVLAHKTGLNYNLGLTLIKKKEGKEAVKRLKKALAINKRTYPEKNRYHHIINLRLCLAYIQQEKKQEALNIIHEAKPFFNRRKNAPGFKKFYDQLKTYQSHILAESGYYDSALNNLQNLIKDNTVNYKAKGQYGNPSINQLIEIQTLKNFILNEKGKILLSLYEKRDKPYYLKKAYSTYCLLDSLHLKYNQKISLQREKASYIRNYQSHFVNGVKATYELIQNEVRSAKSKNDYLNKAFYFAETKKASLLMESMVEKKLEHSDILPDSLISRIKQLDQKISQTQNQIIKTPEDDDDRYELQSKKLKLKNQQSDLFKTIKKQFPKVKYGYSANNPVDLNSLQNQLEEHDKNMVEYTYHDSLLFALVIKPDFIKIKQLAIPDSLNYYIEALRETLIDKKQFAAHKANRLYEILFSPVEPLLDKENLVIVPDGKMGYLPFGMLLKKYNDELGDFDYPYLLKDYAFTYAPSATLWSSKNPLGEKKAEKFYTGFAPSFSNSYQPSQTLKAQNDNNRMGNPSERYNSLPFAKEEVNRSINYWSGTKYIGEQATEKAFKEVAPKSSVIHLATHGIIDDRNPAYNRLYFNNGDQSKEDGILYTYELYDLNLKADLAVLSACNTGIGKIYEGAGIMSLAKGFKIAGCNNILMTLWPVNDRSGAKIINNFYENLKKGYNKEDALRKAKLKYLKNHDPTNANPYYWANFVLMGSEEMVKKPDFSYFGTFLTVSILLVALLVIGLITEIRKKRGSSNLFNKDRQ